MDTYDFINMDIKEDEIVDEREHEIAPKDGWGQYQMLVLAQLKDLTRAVNSNSKKMAQIEKDLVLSEERRSNLFNKVSNIETQINHIMHDEKGLNMRLKNIEQALSIQKESSLKAKAIWGAIGGGVIIVIGIIIDIIRTIHGMIMAR